MSNSGNAVNHFQRHQPHRSPHRPDETLTFFPTYGCRNEDDTGWKVHVHGWVYRPKPRSLKRLAILGVLRRVARLDRETADDVLMNGRLRPFLYDNKRGHRFSIRIGERVFDLPASRSNGHFRATLDLLDESLPPPVVLKTAAPRRIDFSVENPKGHQLPVVGAVRLIGPVGLSVISDIDDTIKISEVTNRRALMANTLLREFRPAETMADTYRRWANDEAAFHYVSGGPWQLFDPLAELLADEHFPDGSMHLREFRLKDRTFQAFLRETTIAKQAVCEQILADFPQRRFIMVGDSGERDPEMYGGLARDFSAQIAHIYIRNVNEESRQSERMQTAFNGVPNNRWSLFDVEKGIVTRED